MANKKSKRPNLLRLFLILGIIMLGVIIWYSYPRPVPVGINLVGSDTGTVTLALTPSSISLTPNIEATLTLSINAGTSHATAAQIELTYDAAKIGTPTITQGDFFTSSISSTTVENGKITVKDDTVVAKAGTQLTKELTEFIMKFGIEPMKIGLNVVCTYQKGEILGKDFKRGKLCLTSMHYRHKSILKLKPKGKITKLSKCA